MTPAAVSDRAEQAADPLLLPWRQVPNPPSRVAGWERRRSPPHAYAAGSVMPAMIGKWGFLTVLLAAISAVNLYVYVSEGLPMITSIITIIATGERQPARRVRSAASGSSYPLRWHGIWHKDVAK